MVSDEETDLTRKHCVALLVPYIEARKERDDATGRVSGMAQLIKGFLEDHPEETLWDGEARIEARLQARRGAPDLDTVSLAEKEPELALWAMRAGLVKLDVKAWDALRGKGQQAAQLMGWIANVAGSVALIVERKD